MTANPKLRNLLQRRLANPHFARAHPPRVAVVEHHDVVVGAEPDIDLDPGSAFNSCGNGDQAVLGDLAATMQPTMRKALRPWMKRVRP